MNKIKIIQVIPSLGKGGAERITVDICNQLSKRENIELILIVFSEENSYEFLTENLNIKYIPSSYVPSVTNKAIKDISMLNDFIVEFKPNIIHLHLYQSIIVFSQINYTEAKYFFHFHDNIRQLNSFNLFKERSKETLSNWYEKKVIEKQFKNKSVTCIGISQSTYNYIVNNVSKNWSKELLFNAIDTSRFYTEKTSGKFQMISIGSLQENKNHVLLIEVVKILVEDGYQVKLIILGDGVLRQRLQDEINLYKLEEHIVLKGNVDLPENYLKESLIYIHTAKSEAFGLVLLEAMASGLPVVCADAGGNRDIIKNGKNGFIFKEFKAELLADKVKELLDNDDLRNTIGDYARNFSKQFDIINYVDELIRLYQR